MVTDAKYFLSLLTIQRLKQQSRKNKKGYKEYKQIKSMRLTSTHLQEGQLKNSSIAILRNKSIDITM